MNTYSTDPKPFVVVTKPGTDPEAFRIFTKLPPDQGCGDFYKFNAILVQTYQTTLTWDGMVEVQREPFIR